MAIDEFFPPRPAATPTIYAFASTHPDHAGLLKVGYTERVAVGRTGTCEHGKQAAALKSSGTEVRKTVRCSPRRQAEIESPILAQ